MRYSITGLGLTLALLVLSLGVVQPAQAIVYNVSVSGPCTGFPPCTPEKQVVVTGQIETDGTIGFLDAINIVDYDLTIAGPNSQSRLRFPENIVLTNNALEATTNRLRYVPASGVENEFSISKSQITGTKISFSTIGGSSEQILAVGDLTADFSTKSISNTSPTVIGAAAKECGGSGSNRVACSCGDTLIESTTLRRSDPITSTSCPVLGLSVGADRIALRCGGLTLTGQPFARGINLEDRSGVTIAGCRITAFSTGVRLEDASNNRNLRNAVFENEAGIELDGSSDRNLVRANKVTSNENDGIRLTKDLDAPERNRILANLVSGNNTEGLSGQGIVDCDDCTSNRYLFNVIQKTLPNSDPNESDRPDGIWIRGSNNTILGNRGGRHGGSGLRVTGEGNRVGSNTFNGNSENGICVVDGNQNAGANRGRNNAGRNIAFKADSCPTGVVPNATVTSATTANND